MASAFCCVGTRAESAATTELSLRFEILPARFHALYLFIATFLGFGLVAILFLMFLAIAPHYQLARGHLLVAVFQVGQ